MIIFRHCFYVIISFDLFVKLIQPLCCLTHKCSLSLRRIHIVFSLQNFQPEHKSIPCLADALLKCLCSQVLYKFIRIFIRIHTNHPRCNPHLFQNRHCPQGRPCSGIIAVISQVHLIHIPLNQLRMSRCKRRPEGRYCISKSGLVQRYHIHITLAQQKIRLP